MVEPRKLHKIWIEQCEAALTIKDRYGLKAAFDYLVGEKLSRSGVRASRLRARAAAIRLRGQTDVTAEEIAAQLKRIERERNERDAAIQDEDDPLPESPIRKAERVRQFTMVKELLTAAVLGTS